jgi:hypothetical protein
MPSTKTATTPEQGEIKQSSRGGAFFAPPLFNALAAIGIKSWQTGYKWGSCLILAILL